MCGFYSCFPSSPLLHKREREFPFWTHGFYCHQALSHIWRVRGATGFSSSCQTQLSFQYQISCSSAALCLFIQKILRVRWKTRFRTAKRKSEWVQREQRCTVRREVPWYTDKKLSPEMGCTMAFNVPLTENLFKPSAWNKADKPTLEKPLICSTMSLLVIWAEAVSHFHIRGKCFPVHRALVSVLCLMLMGCTATDKLFHPPERKLLQDGETLSLGCCLRAKC